MSSKKPTRMKRVGAFFARFSPAHRRRSAEQARLDSTMRHIAVWLDEFAAARRLQAIKRANSKLSDQGAADILLFELNEAHRRSGRAGK
jgi:hypothetical protein